MMRGHVLDYTHDMPDVHVLPGEHVRVKSAIDLPGSQGSVSMTFHAVPFQQEDFPEQWFHGFQLNIDAHPLRQHAHYELTSVARERAAAINKKLRFTQYDFEHAHV